MTENWLFLRSLVFRKGFQKSEINLLRREPRSTFWWKPELCTIFRSRMVGDNKLCGYRNIHKFCGYRNFALCEGASHLRIAQLNYKDIIILNLKIKFYLFLKNAHHLSAGSSTGSSALLSSSSSVLSCEKIEKVLFMNFWEKYPIT